MITFLVRRVLGGVLVIFLVSVVTFLIFQIGPKITGADPAFLYTGKNSTPASVAAVDRALGLDKPLPVQYGTWIKGILVGRSYTDGFDTVSCSAPCLGYSFRVQEPVTQMILGALPVTVSLALGAFILWITGGLLIGVTSALRPGSVLDRGGMVFALVGVSLPVPRPPLRPVPGEPRAVVRQPGPAVDHPRAHVRRPVRTALPRERARDHG
jgi:peptide/nickel transport system permease protein